MPAVKEVRKILGWSSESIDKRSGTNFNPMPMPLLTFFLCLVYVFSILISRIWSSVECM